VSLAPIADALAPGGTTSTAAGGPAAPGDVAARAPTLTGTWEAVSRTIRGRRVAPVTGGPAMTPQPDRFLPMCARAIARPAPPFDTDGPPAVTATGRHDGESLERTPPGYLACPRGRGK
jgi:hypothetical protein